MTRFELTNRKSGRGRLLAIWQQHGLALRLIGMCVLLAVVVLRVDMTSFGRDLQGVDLRLLALSVMLAFLAWLINSFKWQSLLFSTGVRHDLGELFRLNLVAIFYSLALPGQLSGEVLKAIRLGGRRENRNAVYASVWLDRLTGLVGLLIVGIIGFAVGPRPAFNSLETSILVELFLGALAVCLAILALPKVIMIDPSSSGWAWVPGWFATPLRWTLRLITATELAPTTRGLVLAIALSCLFQIASTAVIWTSGLSLGLRISPFALAWIAAIFAVLQLLPISIAGIGVRDLTFVSLLGLYGIPAHQALALSLLAFGHLCVLGLAGWVLDVKLYQRATRMFGFGG